MKKNVLTLTAAIVFVWQTMSFASSSVDALIQKLEDKGILTTQEATQIKGQIASDENESMQKSFKSQIPDWVSGLKISGDFRVRDQVNRRKVPGTTNLTQNRGRFRARLNLEDQINDKVKVGITLATEGGKDAGTLANNRSNNVTFGGNGGTNSGSFTKPYVAIDKAWAKYTPNNYITVTAGKMANPIWEPASLLWDPDITPEGGVIQLEKKFNEYATGFSTNAFFILKDALSATTRTDPYMFVTQDGIKGNLTDKIYYKLAGTAYITKDDNHQFLDNRAAGNTINPLSVNQYKYSYNAFAGALDLGINDPFGDMLPSPIYIPQVGVFGEYESNPDPAHNNSAWMMGGYIGNSAINGWGTWSIKSFYKVLQADSWLDALPSDDFYSGNTDTKGWQTELDLGLAKNVWFVMSYYRTDIYKPISTLGNSFSKSAPENLFQMDLNFKF